MIKLRYLCLYLILSACGTSPETKTNPEYREPHRPQIHFTPKEKWMNDPNGMVFFNNTYHLFYQYFPDSSVWGPMHWGHATSTDLVHWQHQPIALYPDSLGYIFSGSAVVDSNNLTGFGKDGKIPLVAIFTHHDPVGEKSGRNDYQVQSLAYSIDNGNTWAKYEGNPVLKNPGIRDFRDPKLTWYPEQQKWIMTLATLDRITFYSSKDLKNWTKESEFGKEFGAHGGVWECPDLFPLELNGEKIWVLLVSNNPGGPNGGSGTQYFTGNFDGKNFVPTQTDTRWLDYGPDNYAGVTWSNTGNRKIFLGWMSNWDYALLVPTEKWRSAMTIPRDLSLEKIGEQYWVRSMPVPEMNKLSDGVVALKDIEATNYDLSAKTGALAGPARINIKSNSIQDFTIQLSNAAGQKLVIGYENSAKQFYLDRTGSGKVNFEKRFAARHVAPRISNRANLELILVIDDASVELFADNGLTVMTQTFFPDERFTNITINSGGKWKISELNFERLKSIY